MSSLRSDPIFAQPASAKRVDADGVTTIGADEWLASMLATPLDTKFVLLAGAFLAAAGS